MSTELTEQEKILTRKMKTYCEFLLDNHELLKVWDMPLPEAIALVQNALDGCNNLLREVDYGFSGDWWKNKE